MQSTRSRADLAMPSPSGASGYRISLRNGLSPSSGTGSEPASCHHLLQASESAQVGRLQQEHLPTRPMHMLVRMVRSGGRATNVRPCAPVLA